MVADVYDDVRPGFAPGLAEAIAVYHGRPPGRVPETGVGKGTEVLRGLGGALTCVEPDERMAAVLRARFPDVTVLVAPFESAWPGPADVVGCAMAWHWLDPARRNRLAFDALRPGGTLAVFGAWSGSTRAKLRRARLGVARFAYADPAHTRAFAAADPTPPVPRHDDWAFDDIRSSGLFADARLVRTNRPLPMSAERYLRLVRTFGPFRARGAAGQARTLDVLATLDDLGGGTVLDLRTTLALARRA
ncbi:class I SAM-dependent methyltransferase [Dactylosporangium sp. NPDC000555]|uniref:class I SAM-dependent methyltransferase n=1 Tax=Dactylosporangium sp. NPDC000555 TaxID=3154260 RepID=UPI0033321EE8